MHLVLHRADTEKRFQKILSPRWFFPVKWKNFTCLPCLGNVKAGEIANWCHKRWVDANRWFFSSGFLPSCFWLYWLSQYAKVHRRGMGMRYSEAFRAKITQGWHGKQGALSIGLSPPREHRHLLRLGCQVPRKCSLPLPEVCALLRPDETSSRTNRVSRH